MSYIVLIEIGHGLWPGKYFPYNLKLLEFLKLFLFAWWWKPLTCRPQHKTSLGPPNSNSKNYFLNGKSSPIECIRYSPGSIIIIAGTLMIWATFLNLCAPGWRKTFILPCQKFKLEPTQRTGQLSIYLNWTMARLLKVSGCHRIPEKLYVFPHKWVAVWIVRSV